MPHTTKGFQKAKSGLDFSMIHDMIIDAKSFFDNKEEVRRARHRS